MAGWDYGRGALVDGVNDLGLSIPRRIDRRNRKIGVAELALNDQQRDSLARHLHSMSVPELMRREPAPRTGSSRGVM